MAYKIKRKVFDEYIPLSDKLEKQLDRQALAKKVKLKRIRK